MFGIEPLHVIAILVVALLVFGPSRMPEIARALGQSLAGFRAAMQEGQESHRRPAEPENPLSYPAQTSKSDTEIHAGP